jgi:hypothetical protein
MWPTIMGTGRRLAGAQQHRHWPLGRDVVDMEGQEAALTIMAVPERQLLAAVDDIDRLADIECHCRRGDRVAAAIKLDRDVHHPHQFAGRRRILPTPHRRLAGQADGIAWQLAHRRLEAGVVAQMTEIVDILTAAGDRQYSGLQDVGNALDDTALGAGIGNVSGKASGNANSAFGVSQKQHAAILCQPPAIERRCHFLAANRWESKTGNAIVDHGRRGTFCPVFECGANNFYLH